MASFRIINNTNSTLPLSDSLQIAPAAERFVGQITYEMARLESLHMITIIRVPNGSADDALKPDYINTVDPTVVTTTGASGAGTGNNTGGGSGGGGGGGVGGGTGGGPVAANIGLNDLLPATDGSIPEYTLPTTTWSATTAPRNITMDYGNF